MSQETQRMAITYPDEFQDPWFQAFVDFVNALDGHHFASFEDRNLFFTKGGSFSWLASTEVLDWSADLVLVSPSTGIISTLPAGSVSLADGQFMAVDLTRGPTSPVTLSASSVSNLTPSDSPIVICVRNGTKLYFRNGAVLDDGESVQVFDEGPAAAASRLDRLDTFVGDGIQDLFNLSNTPNADSEPNVYQNGVYMSLGNDYTRPIDTQIQFITAPVAGRQIEVRYFT
jgi:hypothetical protein